MKQIKLYLFYLFFSFKHISRYQYDFEKWKKISKIALENNISEATFDLVMTNTKFLPDVIKYDRYQPEFYEDTKTYIKKELLIKIIIGKKFTKIILIK